jgi:alanine racemase
MRKRWSATHILSPRSFAEISSSALTGNYEVLRDRAKGQLILPMIKADAYGHGSVWAAQVLAESSDLYGLGVATLEEGVRLREETSGKARRVPILIFSGATPWNEEKGRLCERHGLRPVISRETDWESFFKQGWPARLSYELKFNTGMNRLGIHPEKARSIIKQIQTLSTDQRPNAVMSHLALGEDPEAALSRKQRERFEKLRGEFESAFSAIQFSLANSAAIWNSKKWKLDDLTEIVRPGLALYGIPPWKGAPAHGLEQVMTLKSEVITVHDLKIGDAVGYGARFRVSSDPACPRRIAVLASGYADGIHRTLSEEAGELIVSGRKEKVLGRVSMDLTAVSCSRGTQVGEYASWISPDLDLWSQAERAKTIPYELLTSVSGRVQRVYD